MLNNFFKNLIFLFSRRWINCKKELPKVPGYYLCKRKWAIYTHFYGNHVNSKMVKMHWAPHPTNKEPTHWRRNTKNYEHH